MEDEFIKPRVLTIAAYEPVLFKEYHLFLILSGHVRGLMDGENFFMDESDLVLCLPGEKVIFWGSGRNMVLDVPVSVSVMEKYIPVHEGRFICNSSVDAQRDYANLRSLMAKLAMASCETGEDSELYEKSVFYGLLYDLKNRHFEKNIVNVPDISRKYSDRVNRIFNYIQENYARNISLDDVSAYTHLSLSYLSRFFKQAFGENFVTYVKKYRVERSLSDLCYSKKTVTQVGMDHGFGDANSYIRAFREIHGTTPKAFRDRFNAGNERQSTVRLCEITDRTRYVGKLQEYSLNDSGRSGEAMPESRHYIVQADLEGMAVAPLWKCGINISSAKNIGSGDISDEISEIQKDIGFAYGRVSFLLMNRYVFKDTEQGGYNFFSFTKMVSHLLSVGMIPYLDLTFSHEECKTPGGYEVDEAQFLDWLEQMLLYSVNVFGREEMEKWIYDIGITYSITDRSIEKTAAFISRYIKGEQIIRRILPEARIGGFNVTSDMADVCMEILSGVLEAGGHPDFISMSIFPYVFVGDKAGERMVYSSDPEYALHRVQEWKRAMGHCQGMDGRALPIYVNAIGTTVAQRNYINDTCYQATFIVKNIISLLGEVGLLIFYQMSDYNFSYAENHLLLNGRNGLFSQFQIHKPGYIAFSMMSRLTELVLAKGQDYIVTKGKHDTYYILLCNHVPVSDRYCLRIWDNTPISEAYTVYAQADDLNVLLTLNHVKDGDYRILSYHLNRENGSLFDEWEKTGFWENPGTEELKYLRQAIHPRRNCSKRGSFNGQLNFHIGVKPFEVIFIEASLII